MQNLFFDDQRYVLAFILIASNLLLLSCTQDTANSNVATLYYPTPTPSSNTQTLLENPSSSAPTATAAPSAQPSLPTETALSPATSHSPQASPTASISRPADDIPSANNLSNVNVSDEGTLMIPVVGVRREELRDTFKDARSEERVHDAIDIMAAHNTPVVAAADGEIARFFDSERGGITIYQFSTDKKLIYYYAHLDRRAENLREGAVVKQGTLLGYVGDTGNSGAGNYHLHFAVWTVDDPKRYWEGTNINPYELLKQGKPGEQRAQ